MNHDRKKPFALAAMAVAFSILPAVAYAAGELVTKAADRTERGDGTRSAAALVTNSPAA